MLKQPKLLLTGMALALASGVVLADGYEGTEPGFQVSIAGGIASLDVDGTFDATEVETNSLHSEEEWDSWTAMVGVGYVFPLFEMEDDEDEEFFWFPTITPQLNLYYLGGGDVDGDVHRFQSHDFNQADFDLDLNSTRLMLDFDLAVANYEEFTLYALAGLGIAWNDTDFSVRAKEGECDSLNQDFDGNNDASFAFEFGGGLDYAFAEDMSIYLEYLWTDLGDADLSGSSDDDHHDFDDGTDSDIDLTSQAVLLGLNFSL